MYNKTIHQVYQHMKQSGAAEACWAHNPEVQGSKPCSAILEYWQYLWLLNNIQLVLLVVIIKRSFESFRISKMYARTGNRTRASRVAGENSTTEPSVLLLLFLNWSETFNLFQTLNNDRLKIHVFSLYVCLFERAVRGLIIYYIKLGEEMGVRGSIFNLDFWITYQN